MHISNPCQRLQQQTLCRDVNHRLYSIQPIPCFSLCVRACVCVCLCLWPYPAHTDHGPHTISHTSPRYSSDLLGDLSHNLRVTGTGADNRYNSSGSATSWPYKYHLRSNYHSVSLTLMGGRTKNNFLCYVKKQQNKPTYNPHAHTHTHGEGFYF